MLYRQPLPSQAELRRIFDYDPATGIFRWRYRPEQRATWNSRWVGKPAGGKASNGYVYIKIDGRSYVAQRLALVYEHGDIPAGHEADHRDLTRDKNRIEGLRPATRSQNKANGPRYRNNRSGLKGVYKRPGRWVAQIRVGGKLLSLGSFATKEDAHRAYAAAAHQHFGEFARP